MDIDFERAAINTKNLEESGFEMHHFYLSEQRKKQLCILYVHIDYII